MRVLPAIVLFAACFVTAAPDASAGTRIYCDCKSGKKTWIHHNYACEYHFKLPFKKSAAGYSKPVNRCSGAQGDSFHTWMCKDGCREK
jgi:hypothetical protein